ncbi:MAG: hypothetical protein ABEK12_01500 [Candidatus Nanohaloarchaea archaeon]
MTMYRALLAAALVLLLVPQAAAIGSFPYSRSTTVSGLTAEFTVGVVNPGNASRAG